MNLNKIRMEVGVLPIFLICIAFLAYNPSYAHPPLSNWPQTVWLRSFARVLLFLQV
jgi:hypothetical protein